MKKLYYKIKEVAEMFDLNISKLRHWEKEIKVLKPKRNDKKTRYYSQKDIEIIKQIKYLYEEEYLRLEGVNKKLLEKKDEVDRRYEAYERLTNIRNRLQGIIDQIDKMNDEAVE